MCSCAPLSQARSPASLTPPHEVRVQKRHRVSFRPASLLSLFFSDPGNKRVFKNITAVRSREVVSDDGNVQGEGTLPPSPPPFCCRLSLLVAF